MPDKTGPTSLRVSFATQAPVTVDSRVGTTACRHNPCVVGDTQDIAPFLRRIERLVPLDGSNRIEFEAALLVVVPGLTVSGSDCAKLSTSRQTALETPDGRPPVMLALAAPVVVTNAFGYFEFFVYCLPRLLRVVEHDVHVPLLMFLTGFITDVLEWLRISNPLLAYDPGRTYCLTTALDITGDPRATPCPADLARVRSWCAIMDGTLARRRGVLVKRNRAQRAISNYADVRDALLRAYPELEWVEYTGSTFAGTLETFRGCSVVVASHGSELTNILFAPSHAGVVEITPAEPDLRFWHMAACLGQHHAFVPARESTHENTASAPIWVDPDAVVAAVSYVLETATHDRGSDRNMQSPLPGTR